MHVCVIIWSLCCLASAQSVPGSVRTNGSEALGASCIDREGRPVKDGDRYAPDEDPCKTCYCSDGVAQLCTLVQCSPPSCPKWEPIRNECCQFRCLDWPYDMDRNSTRSHFHPNELSGAGFDLRLALSGTTSLLIVALLIFMVHRLRQRRLLIVMRRIAEEQHCIDHDESPFSADEVAGFDFLSYKDPPPPYSSPHQTLDRRYDPPPYESTTICDVSMTALLDGGDVNSNMTVPVQAREPVREQELQSPMGLTSFYTRV